jgi:hypothetical protein
VTYYISSGTFVESLVGNLVVQRLVLKADRVLDIEDDVVGSDMYNMS